MSKLTRPSFKKVSPEEAIEISSHLSISSFMESAEVVNAFRQQNHVHIPTGFTANFNFYKMIGAVWTAGYITGIRKERAKGRSSHHKVE